MKLAVIPNLSKRDARKYTLQSIDILHRLGAELFMHDEMKQEFAHQPVAFYPEIEELIEHCDIVIAIGGDGTIIHASKYASAANKPVLGINVGRPAMLQGWKPMNCAVWNV